MIHTEVGGTLNSAPSPRHSRLECAYNNWKRQLQLFVSPGLNPQFGVLLWEAPGKFHEGGGARSVLEYGQLAHGFFEVLFHRLR